MKALWTPERCPPLPSRGWVREATPIEAFPEDAERLGFSWFGFKRDDQLPALLGGTKVRKLDLMLAVEPWRDAPGWVSVGAIGSGQLTALTAAAQALDRRLRAHLFWEVPSPAVLQNLAFVTTGPTDLRFHSNRFALAVQAPRVLVARSEGGLPVVPVGASNGEGTLAIAAAMLELRVQIDGGLLPEPAVIVAPLGSSGTVAGLAAGAALTGISSEIWAVSTVERPLARLDRIRSMMASAAKAAVRHGWPWSAVTPVRIRLIHDAVGPGYGVPTPGSEAGTRWLRGRALAGEPVYSGKAIDALLRHGAGLQGKAVLFWLTPRRPTLPPPREDWREQLPTRLRRRLEAAEGAPAVRTRRWVLGAVGLSALALPWLRPTRAWLGPPLRKLSPEEAHIVFAAARALLPDVPGQPIVDGPTWETVVSRVDQWLTYLTARSQLEVRGLLQLVERGTAIDGRWAPLTRLTPEGAEQTLGALSRSTRLAGVAVRGLRDLLLVACWQEDGLWASIGWPGPWVPKPDAAAPRRPDGLPSGPSRYTNLVAPAGAVPRAML